MAHSFLSVRNSTTERTIAVTDSLLHLFMYFFNEEIKNNELNENQLEILNHYNLELNQMNISFIDLKLQEIFQEKKLRTWFISKLENLKSSIELFGEVIDNNYLKKIKKLKKEFSKPLKISKLINLINDLNWLLSKENIIPSEEFKWFED